MSNQQEIVCDKCKAVLAAGASLQEHNQRVHDFREEVKAELKENIGVSEKTSAATNQDNNKKATNR
jgi:hypothetical protein